MIYVCGDFHDAKTYQNMEKSSLKTLTFLLISMCYAASVQVLQTSPIEWEAYDNLSKPNCTLPSLFDETIVEYT